MISLHLCLKEPGKGLETIVSKDFEGGEASSLFRKVEEEFADYQVDGLKKDEPFLYMRLVPIMTNPKQAASIVPTASFQVEVKGQMVEFIEASLGS